MRQKLDGQLLDLIELLIGGVVVFVNTAGMLQIGCRQVVTYRAQSKVDLGNIA